jgi:type III restriction enzyme
MDSGWRALQSRTLSAKTTSLARSTKLQSPDLFFERPILNSPYAYPAKHWELEDGQPTQRILNYRRPAEYITPIPKPKKKKAPPAQAKMVFDEGAGLSTAQQEYDPTPVINDLRRHVDQWRRGGHSGVTPDRVRGAVPLRV